jgi:2-polyprenyl-6-methoxyphenol hydroxylase-like FAD-dependent oxidoreductase
VVGADGRGSSVRNHAGFSIQRDPEHLLIAGLLLSGNHLPKEAIHWVPHFSQGKVTILLPLDEGRMRVYLITRRDAPNHQRLTGAANVENFIVGCFKCGVTKEWMGGAVALGPLAEFEGADVWVNSPYHQGVVLIGDAAAASDPSWGSGLSMTLRDVRMLRDQLLAQEDWHVAAQAYAIEHDQVYERFHRIEGWYTQLFYDIGPSADERRERAFSRRRQHVPDIMGLGPDSPCDEQARRNFFGEE